MPKKNKYVFGPVPSRRLGLSLGVDMVPFKVCTLDCMYCQIGHTTEKTVQRKDFVPLEDVLSELKEKLNQGVKADFVTLSGSGEPTLNKSLGELVSRIKKLTEIPVAILTNGTLLADESVRKDCAKADVVLPSLDAADQDTFQHINRPYCDINIENVISGLCTFRNEYRGQIWLEVFLIEGVNTAQHQIENLKRAIKKIRPDKIQLNTAVRPTVDSNVKKVDFEKLGTIAEQLGKKAEVVADFMGPHGTTEAKKDAEEVLSMLKRRPCSLDDISLGMGMVTSQVQKYIDHLLKQGAISAIEKGGTIFYKAN